MNIRGDLRAARFSHGSADGLCTTEASTATAHVHLARLQRRMQAQQRLSFAKLILATWPLLSADLISLVCGIIGCSVESMHTQACLAAPAFIELGWMDLFARSAQQHHTRRTGELGVTLLLPDAALLAASTSALCLRTGLGDDGVVALSTALLPKLAQLTTLALDGVGTPVLQRISSTFTAALCISIVWASALFA
eukprot:SAG11_NODE_8790_length_976_cov_0.970353_1_plen_195_part_00